MTGTSTPSIASGAVASQSGSAWLAGSPAARLRRNTMSVTTDVPSRLKASDGRRIAPRKSALLGQVLAGGGVLLVERVMAGDQGQDAAGLQGVERLGDEEIVQRQLLAAIVEPARRRRAGCRSRRRRCPRAASCRGNSRCGCRRRGAGRGRCGRRCESSSTPMNRMPAGAWVMKLPVPQPGSSTVASSGTPRRPDRLVHGLR